MDQFAQGDLSRMTSAGWPQQDAAKNVQRQRLPTLNQDDVGGKEGGAPSVDWQMESMWRYVKLPERRHTFLRTLDIFLSSKYVTSWISQHCTFDNFSFTKSITVLSKVFNRMQSCVADDQLLLNSSKTESFFFGTSQQIKFPCLPFWLTYALVSSHRHVTRFLLAWQKLIWWCLVLLFCAI